MTTPQERAQLAALIDALHEVLGKSRRKVTRSDALSALLNVLAHQALSMGISRAELLANVEAAYELHEGRR